MPNIMPRMVGDWKSPSSAAASPRLPTRDAAHRHHAEESVRAAEIKHQVGRDREARATGG